MAEREDHDQRFKNLLLEFFRDFFRLFFPAWAERFDFDRITWLMQEVFPDPPTGERRVLDLVAQLPTRQVVAAQRPGDADSWIALILVEPWSRDSVTNVRAQVYDYYAYLRRKYRIPVLPIGVYLRVGLEGIGMDVYKEDFWELCPLHFEFLYVGLPRLDGLQFLEGENWLGVALSALMKIPADRKAWLKAEALRRLVNCPENAVRRHLLCECVQAYLPLEPPELQEFEQLLITPPYQEVRQMQATWYEQGLARGLEKGRQENREFIRVLLEERFGPLNADVLHRLESWPADRLNELGLGLIRGQSLQDLGLAD